MYHLSWFRRAAPLFFSMVSLPVLFVIVFHIDIHHLGPEPVSNAGLSWHTEIGQREAIALEDLTELHLNAATSIVFRETLKSRQLDLQRGEILANVHHDDKRPFEVIINHAVLLDVGTIFDVSTHDNATDISVQGGEIRIYQQKDNGERVDPLVETSDGAPS